MDSQAKQNMAGISKVIMNSGEKEVKFTFNSIEIIKEQTGLNPPEFLQSFYEKALKKTTKTKNEMDFIQTVSNNIEPSDVAMLLYAGLAHTKQYKTIEEVKDDMIAGEYYVYMGAVVTAVGKLITDFITPRQTI